MRTVTRYTHSHRQRLELRDPLHRFDWTVTLLALYAGRYVAAVIEARVIRQAVHSYPLDWFVSGNRLRDLLNLRRILLDLRVAIHTRRSGRDARDTGLLGGRVTVQTLNLVIAGVHLVRKGDRLNRFITLLIAEPRERRALQQHNHAGDRDSQ